MEEMPAGTPAVHVMRVTAAELESDDWRLAIGALIDRGVGRIALDLSAIGQPEPLDASIGKIVWLLKNLRDAGGDLHLFSVPPHVTSFFKAMGLDAVFQVHDGEAEAIAAFRE